MYAFVAVLINTINVIIAAGACLTVGGAYLGVRDGDIYLDALEKAVLVAIAVVGVAAVFNIFL